MELPKYIRFEPDRHGNERYYVRVPGKPRVRLHGVPFSTEFMDAYKAALVSHGQASPKSLEWLCWQYYKNAYFTKSLSPDTQRKKRAVLDEICGIKRQGRKVGDIAHKAFTPGDIRKLRDAKAAFPAAANIRVKELKALFNWAIRNEKCTLNPATKVEEIGAKTTGFYTWTDKDVRAYEARWPVGSKQRLAMAIMLYLGVRRSDAVRLGNGHIEDEQVTFQPHKGREKHPQTLTLPVLPPFRAILDASELGPDTWLVTAYGVPYSEKSFGMKFKEWCIAAGTHADASPHGLRKIGAVKAAEGGASEYELMSIFGWQNAQEARTYTRMAEQRRMAASGLGKAHGMAAPVAAPSEKS
jgi:integrase